MPALVGVGKGFLSKVFTAVVSPGTSLDFPVPVKSFIIKPVGGSIFFKFISTDSDANAFQLGDGEALQLDISLRYPIATNISTIGIVFTSSGSVQVNTIVAY